MKLVFSLLAYFKNNLSFQPAFNVRSSPPRENSIFTELQLERRTSHSLLFVHYREKTFNSVSSLKKFMRMERMW